MSITKKKQKTQYTSILAFIDFILRNVQSLNNSNQTIHECTVRTFLSAQVLFFCLILHKKKNQTKNKKKTQQLKKLNTAKKSKTNGLVYYTNKS